MDTVDQQAQRARHDRATERLTGESEHNERRPALILVPALTVVLIAALDLTVIAPILPAILTDLQINSAEADRYVWIVSGYLIAYTLTIPLLGRLSDALGRRATFMIALGIFLLGSGVCAFSDSLAGLIAGRAIQGFGGGAMVPVSMALVGDVLPPWRRAAALGIVAAVDTIGWVLGPIWGAAFTELFGTWRAVFVLNIPIGLLAGLVLVFAWRHPQPRALISMRTSPDVMGALLLSVALLSLNLGFSAGSEAAGTGQQQALGASPNPLAPYQWPLVALGAVALVGLVLVERRAARPLIPLSLFRSRQFSAANATNWLVGAALMVAMVNVPLLVALLETEERTGIVSAQLLGAFSLAMAVGALIGGRLTNLAGYRFIVLAGLVIAAVGFWLMSGWPNRIEMARMSLDLLIAGFGFGLVIAPIGAAAINAARRQDLGIASGLVMVMRLLGMTLGISLLTGWAVSRINQEVGGLPPLPQVPGESIAEYFLRQQEYALQEAIPLTLAIIRDTFAVAAILCVLAMIPAFLLRKGPRDESESNVTL